MTPTTSTTPILDLDPRSGELAAEGVMRWSSNITMRDGVQLATDIYAGQAAGQPLPVLLERTPYGRRHGRRSDQDRHDQPVPDPEQIAAYFVRAGYVVVRQDCRGRGESGGTFTKYLNEGPDGADSIDWLAAQPWCDGRVVMTGTSYSAHVQSAAAGEGPAGLAAMFQDSGGLSSAYEAGTRMGGAFELKQLTWAVRHAAMSADVLEDPVLSAALADVDLRDWFTSLPWRRGASPLRHVPEYEDYLFEQWAQEQFSEYWMKAAIYGRGVYDRFPDIPSLHFGSWYDPYVRSTIENHRSLGRSKQAPTFLVMGPWTHGRRCDTFAGDVDFGAAAALSIGLDESYLAFRRQWFDAALGRTEHQLPTVQYFLMGGGTGHRNCQGRLDHGGAWCRDDTWPPKAARLVNYALGADRRLSPEAAHVEAGSLTYDFDPSDPVPTIGGQVTSLEPIIDGGAFDQTPDRRVFGATRPYLPLDTRPDVISFVTEELTDEVLVTGPVSATLYVSSSAVDTDFTIKLIDVYPPSADYPHGFAMNLTEGILRARFHRSFEESSLLTPHETYRVEVVAPDTANRFAAGHRIRLDISSSNFPRFDVNPNTGEPTVTSRRSVVATNTIHTSREEPSLLHLWVSCPGSISTSSAETTGT
jgi:putative CocE/NonD family hydrolase